MKLYVANDKRGARSYIERLYFIDEYNIKRNAVAIIQRRRDILRLIKGRDRGEGDGNGSSSGGNDSDGGSDGYENGDNR
ncbi:hypothetical protein C1645_829440 [Glomus cerebriforme]|uniref:Uncharacterized protein n=1 Tax=Glomus cerebriforme TaxID=658196 RepID=A0A397SJX5_9GLOM|nr:hypothetical protein C1645_829440 [Glomus cerebriforme]